MGAPSFRADSNTPLQAGSVSTRCPACGDNGTFHAITGRFALSPSRVVVAIYVCPRPDCHEAIFIATEPDGEVLTSFPPRLIEFDATNLPTEVREALEEAIQCHANDCFVAAAMMVRKTLEELCGERGATGDNLKARIADLGGKIVLPRELLEGLDDLRLLGNDAAHIESRVFNGIGREEVEVGIEFTQEVLKAVYQYSDLLSRLRALKQNPSP
jgi:hypothetical protein